MGDVSMLARRPISAYADFVRLNFFFEFHIFLHAFDKQKCLTRTLLDLSRSIRCLCFPMQKTVLELNFIARGTVCCSAIKVCLTHCVMRARLDASPKREAISHSVKLLRTLLHVVNIRFVKSWHSLSRILSVRFLLLITPSCEKTQENMILKYLSMKS